MGWCYTFGVDCHSGCKHPMMVRDTLDGCECDACGTVCPGKFANCWRSVFQPNGRVLQLRCIPPNLPALVSAEPAGEPPAAAERVVTVGTLTDFAADAEAGGNGNGHGSPIDETVEVRSILERLSAEVERLSAEVADLAARESVRQLTLDDIAGRLTAISVAIPAVAPIKAVPERPQGDYSRPGRAVAHPEAIISTSTPDDLGEDSLEADARAIGGSI